MHCTNGPVCWYCMPGYYLDGSQVCQRCPLPCYTCSSSTQCTSCISNAYLLQNDTCVPCFDITGTPNCTTCGSNYNTTSNTTEYFCYSCLNVTYLDNAACISCVSPCATCSSSSTCSSCINDTYYLTSSNTCSACSSSITHCITCFPNSICTSCDAGYNIVFRPSTHFSIQIHAPSAPMLFNIAIIAQQRNA